MKMNKSMVAVAISTAVGLSAYTGAASAVQIAAGDYNMIIQQTPTFTVNGSTYNNIGTDGAWNSTFTFGAPPNNTSQTMTDNGTSVTWNSIQYGSSVLEGDNTTAGTLGITVSASGALSVTSFNVDAVFSTAGGTFVQYANDLTNMDGVSTAGSLTLDMTGRLGAIGNFEFFDKPWNINDWTAPCSTTTGCASNGNTTYSGFTTGSTANSAGTINGANVVNVGDVNADGIDDYTAVLVQASEVGSQWGGFASTPFFETWNVEINSSAVAPIPVPAAVWLFGSGLIGLVGVARRKKTNT